MIEARAGLPDFGIESFVTYEVPQGMTFTIRPDVYFVPARDGASVVAFHGPSASIHRLEPSVFDELIRCFHGQRSIPFRNGRHHKLLAARLLYPPGFATETYPAPEIVNHQEVWLELVGSCELACQGCFAAQAQWRDVKLKRRMDQEVLHLGLRRVFDDAHKRGRELVKVKYAGGEPTTDQEYLMHAITYATQCADQTKVSIKHVVVTNGYALFEKPELLTFFREHAVHVAVSIDGPEKAHDRFRVSKGGKTGSYRRALLSLEALRLAGVSHNVSTVINKYNARELGSFVEEIQSRFGWTPMRFGLVRSNPFEVEDTIPKNEDLTLGMKDAINGLMQYARLHGTEVNFSKLFDYSHVGPRREYPCGAPSGHYVVIGLDGYLSSCHMNTRIPNARSQKVIPLIDSRKDVIALAQETFPVHKDLRNVSLRENVCSCCALKGQCVGGGCQLPHIDGEGRYHVFRPRHCEAFMTLVPYMAAAHAEQLRDAQKIRIIDHSEPSVDEYLESFKMLLRFSGDLSST